MVKDEMTKSSNNATNKNKLENQKIVKEKFPNPGINGSKPQEYSYKTGDMAKTEKNENKRKEQIRLKKEFNNAMKSFKKDLELKDIDSAKKKIKDVESIAKLVDDVKENLMLDLKLDLQHFPKNEWIRQRNEQIKRVYMQNQAQMTKA